MSANPSCIVAVRLYGGAYLASVEGTGIQASCTARPEAAARRAAGKALRVLETRVALAPTASTKGRMRYVATVAPEGGVE